MLTSDSGEIAMRVEEARARRLEAETYRRPMLPMSEVVRWQHRHQALLFYKRTAIA